VTAAVLKCYNELAQQARRQASRTQRHGIGIGDLGDDRCTGPDSSMTWKGAVDIETLHDPTPLGSKDMVVVYREDKQLIITAFLTSERSKLLRKRRAIWQRPSL
jgi:hypothetical protein